MFERPTQEKLDTAHGVLEWFQEYIDDPYLTFQTALDNLPIEMKEIMKEIK